MTTKLWNGFPVKASIVVMYNDPLMKKAWSLVYGVIDSIRDAERSDKYRDIHTFPDAQTPLRKRYDLWMRTILVALLRAKGLLQKSKYPGADEVRREISVRIRKAKRYIKHGMLSYVRDEFQNIMNAFPN